MKISIILPCYNELANLEFGVLGDVYDYLSKQDFTWEVIIIDDASTDGSFDFCEKFCDKHDAFSVFSIKHGGKPLAVWEGIKRAKGEAILFADMDQSTPMKELSKLLSFFTPSSDLVIGSRGGTRTGFSVSRKLASSIFQNSRKLLILPSIEDTQCGFKLIRRTVALELFSKLSVIKNAANPQGWTVSAFDVELLYLAQKANKMIVEIEVEWKDEDRSTTKDRFKGGQFVFESLGMAREILNVRINDIFGRY